MKTCHACGCQVEDKELVCPECGATVVMATSGLSLKFQEAPKKKQSSMGTTISTGSGLTDILRGEDDNYEEADPFGGGSLPSSLAKNYIEEEERKRKKKINKAIGTVVKVVLLIAVVIAAYMFVTKVILKKKGFSSADEALDVFVEALNDGDVDAMAKVVPKVMGPQDEAEWFIKQYEGVKITGYNVLEHKDISRNALDQMQLDIKAQSNVTLDFEAGYELVMDVKGTGMRYAGSTAKEFVLGEETSIIAVKIKGAWYLLLDSVDEDVFLPGRY